MNESPELIRKELAALAAKPEHDIDFSDSLIAIDTRIIIAMIIANRVGAES